jgi:murein DD-endopeptidase MepM/ murein hydrolase activator NlpD
MKVKTMGLLIVFCVVLSDGCARTPHVPPIASRTVPRGYPMEIGNPVVLAAFGEARKRHAHAGIDIKAPKNTKVRATADGRVTFSGRMHGYGRCVIVAHADGWETVYAHLKKLRVRKDARVRTGQVLGGSGSSGRSSTPHLHYEVRKDGKAVDPAPLLSLP